jgi:hypothetical protein
MDRSVVLHFWNQGYRCAAEIVRMTNIPVRTVQYSQDPRTEAMWSIGVEMVDLTRLRTPSAE